MKLKLYHGTINLNSITKYLNKMETKTDSPDTHHPTTLQKFSSASGKFLNLTFRFRTIILNINTEIDSRHCEVLIVTLDLESNPKP